jgi:hypothetical protein
MRRASRAQLRPQRIGRRQLRELAAGRMLLVVPRLAPAVFPVALWIAFADFGLAQAAAQPARRVFGCPMHAEIRRSAAGRCPICGMALEEAGAEEVREHQVELATTPTAPRAGTPLTLALTIRDPDGRPVGALAVVHERPLHLFLVDESLTSLQHLHPGRATKDGPFTVKTQLPRPGRYALFVDFVPQGGLPQLVPRTLVTAGYDAPLRPAALTPDRVLRQRVGDLEVSLAGPPLVAGEAARLVVRVTEGGRPAALRPYLGALAHVLAVAEDLGEAIHTHAERDPRGELSIELTFPRAGRYRLWLQLSRKADPIDAEPLTFGYVVSATNRSAAYLE